MSSPLVRCYPSFPLLDDPQFHVSFPQSQPWPVVGGELQVVRHYIITGLPFEHTDNDVDTFRGVLSERDLYGLDMD